MSLRSLRITYRCLWALLGFLLGLTAYFGKEYIALDRRDPVHFSGAEALNSPLREGQDLAVMIYRNKIRDDCPVTSIRAAQTRDGRLIPLVGEVWPGGPIGDALYYEYPTGHLPPGEYILKVDLVYACPGDLLFYHHQPDISFRVLGSETGGG